jgi:hypothetical protein
VPLVSPPASATIVAGLDEHDVAVEHVDIQTSVYRLEQMRRRLISRCKHLLEVAAPTMDLMKNAYYGGPVDFLHRTVRDFLDKPAVQQRLLAWAGDFDVDEAVCHGITTQIRLTPLFRDPGIEDRWPSQLAGCLLWHAGHLHAREGSPKSGIKHATEFFKLMKAHALRHRKPIEHVFQGIDISHHDPADPKAPFDRGIVAARLRLTHLVYQDSELSQLALPDGRAAHPAWKRTSSSSARGLGEGSQQSGKESNVENNRKAGLLDAPLNEGEKKSRQDRKAWFKNFFHTK